MQRLQTLHYVSYLYLNVFYLWTPKVLSHQVWLFGENFYLI